MTPGAFGNPAGFREPDVEPAEKHSRLLLMMFVHSECPCSRASLAELREVVAANPQTADVRIYLRTDSNSSADWNTTASARRAAEIQGAAVIADADGAIAARHNVETSGHVVVYSAAGNLLFSGGMTAARGHVSENPGKSAVSDLLAGRQPVCPQHSVFGCPLFEAASPAAARPPCPARN
ncbi:MAG: hypothetical protein HY290_04670 [Planctomycetia bacterium]|nr:hypothetical protein [Planctomycetia bacterium]